MLPNIGFRSRPLCAAALLLSLALGLSGCANSYKVRVDALHNPDVPVPVTYRLIPRDEVKADFDPDFAPGVALIDAALGRRGFRRAINPQDAEMEIEIDFGLGHCRKRAVHEDDLIASGIAHPPSSRAKTSSADPSALPTRPPLTRVAVVNVYQKFLSLSARETPTATRGLRNPAELWRVRVALEETEPDVSACLPILIAAAVENIGASTERRRNVRVIHREPPTHAPIVAGGHRP